MGLWYCQLPVSCWFVPLILFTMFKSNFVAQILYPQSRPKLRALEPLSPRALVTLILMRLKMRLAGSPWPLSLFLRTLERDTLLWKATPGIAMTSTPGTVETRFVVSSSRWRQLFRAHSSRTAGGGSRCRQPEHHCCDPFGRGTLNCHKRSCVGS